MKEKGEKKTAQGGIPLGIPTWRTVGGPAVERPGLTPEEHLGSGAS